MLQAWLALVLAAPTAAGDVVADPDPSGIYGGEPAGECAWPTAVSLGSCTATLVHPQVIVYAAHCGSGYSSAFFGNDTDNTGRSVSTNFCKTNPGFGNLGNGNDWAFCVLDEPVTDVPIAPPLMGCETELLKPGADVWMVGFGNNDNGGYGRKYQANATLNYLTDGEEANIGGNGTGVTICNGDSGGPAYIKLPESDGFDGSWRAFGIASWIYTPCGNEGFHTLMHTGMTWIEGEAGIDITPCHDADGTWNPGPDCKGFAMDPVVGQGAWNTCEFGEVSGWSSACGPSYPELTDLVPPEVAVVSHSDGDTVESEGALTALVITVAATDPDGAGVRDVQLLVEGTVVGAADDTAPYEFALSLPDGVHTVSAVAVDDADNTAQATAVSLEVRPGGAPPPDGDDGGADEGEESDEGADDEADGGSEGGAGALDPALPAGYGTHASSGCATHGRRDAPVGLICLLLVTAARRPRRADLR